MMKKLLTIWMAAAASFGAEYIEPWKYPSVGWRADKKLPSIERSDYTNFTVWATGQIHNNQLVDYAKNSTNMALRSPCATFGLGDYLAVAGITTANVVTCSGSAVPTAQSNRISFTVGTAWDIRVNGVLVWPAQEDSGSTLYSVNSAYNNATINLNTSEVAFWSGVQTNSHYFAKNGGLTFTDGTRVIYVPKLADGSAPATNAIFGYVVTMTNGVGCVHNGGPQGFSFSHVELNYDEIIGAGRFGIATVDTNITGQITEFRSKRYFFPFRHSAGTVNPSWSGIDYIWYMANGSVYTNTNPTGLQPAGISYLSVPSWGGDYILSDNDTNARFVGDLSDLPALTYYLSLNTCSNVTGALSDLPALTYYLSLAECSKITGDLSDLPNLTYYLSLASCTKITGSLSDLPPLTYYLDLFRASNITGDLSDLPPLTYHLGLGNCSKITGDLSDLPNLTYLLNLSNCSKITGDLSDLPPLTNRLDLNNCSKITGNLSDLPALTYYLNIGNCTNIIGVMPTNCKPTYVLLRDSGLSLSDIEGNIIKLDSDGKSNGTLITSSVTLTNSSAISSYTNLISRGWLITGAIIP